MHNPVAEAKQEFRSRIEAAFRAAFAAGELPEAELPDFIVEIPNDSKNGDLATNAALVSARALHTAPKKIAETLVSHLGEGGIFTKAEVAGPGSSTCSTRRNGMRIPSPPFWRRMRRTAAAA
jgi:arginyl-tRNA synthetase